MKLTTLAFLSFVAAAAACAADDDDSVPDVDSAPGAVDAPAGGADSPPSAFDAAPGTPDSAASGSDAAGTDPAENGTYGFKATDVSIPGSEGGRTVKATLTVPSDDGASIATRGAPFPFVVISPGFQMPRAQYTTYARHLASWGFIVVVQDYADLLFPNHDKVAADIKAINDWALGAQSGVAGSIDAGKLATAGHSLGGKMSFYAATLDSRIRAVVGWDPVDSNSPSVAPEKMGSFTAAAAILGETTNASGGMQPCAPTADNFHTFYQATPSPAMEITVNGANHMDWVDDTGCALCGMCSPAGTIGTAKVHALTRRVTVAWLRRRLLGDTAMDAWLALSADVTAGDVTVVSK